MLPLNELIIINELQTNVDWQKKIEVEDISLWKYSLINV